MFKVVYGSYSEKTSWKKHPIFLKPFTYKGGQLVISTEIENSGPHFKVYLVCTHFSEIPLPLCSSGWSELQSGKPGVMLVCICLD